MSQTRYSSHQIGALRRKIGPIHAAIDAGDMEVFKQLLLVNDADGAPRVADEMARALMAGYPADDSPKPDIWSLGERCLHRNQPEMLRVALSARHPDMVNSLLAGSKASWLTNLCTKHFLGEFASNSLVAAADWNDLPWAVPFIKIVLEIDPDDRGLWSITAGTSSAAMVAAAQMELQVEAALLSSEPVTAGVASRPRRDRHV
ncbi:hypothetical protein [Paucibacter soli]|uniref:hypothetical protein n=1 Tax=Paucibacter soli TaxID=3133433 RepID=UPI0030AA343B